MGCLHVTTRESETSWRDGLSSNLTGFDQTVRCVHTVDGILDISWRDGLSSDLTGSDQTVRRVHTFDGISDTEFVDDFPYWSVLNLSPGVHLDCKEPPLRFAPDDYEVYRAWEAQLRSWFIPNSVFSLPLGKDRQRRFRLRSQSAASVRRRQEKAFTQQRQTQEDRWVEDACVSTPGLQDQSQHEDTSDKEARMRQASRVRHVITKVKRFSEAATAEYNTFQNSNGKSLRRDDVLKLQRLQRAAETAALKYNKLCTDLTQAQTASVKEVSDTSSTHLSTFREKWKVPATASAFVKELHAVALAYYEKRAEADKTIYDSMLQKLEQENAQGSTHCNLWPVNKKVSDIVSRFIRRPSLEPVQYERVGWKGWKIWTPARWLLCSFRWAFGKCSDVISGSMGTVAGLSMYTRNGDTGSSADRSGPSPPKDVPSGGRPERDLLSPKSPTSELPISSGMGHDLSVGVYPIPHPSNPHRCILYGYSLHLQQLTLCLGEEPGSSQWRSLAREWVRDRGSPSNLGYDPCSVTEDMLNEIRTVTNVCGDASPDTINHSRFKQLLRASVTWATSFTADVEAGSVPLPIISQILQVSCNHTFWGSNVNMSSNPPAQLASPVSVTPDMSTREQVVGSVDVTRPVNPSEQLASLFNAATDIPTLDSVEDSANGSIPVRMSVQANDEALPSRLKKCQGIQHGKTCRRRIPSVSDNRLCDSCMGRGLDLETGDVPGLDLVTNDSQAPVMRDSQVLISGPTMIVDTGLVTGDISVPKSPRKFDVNELPPKRSRFWFYVDQVATAWASDDERALLVADQNQFTANEEREARRIRRSSTAAGPTANTSSMHGLGSGIGQTQSILISSISDGTLDKCQDKVHPPGTNTVPSTLWIWWCSIWGCRGQRRREEEISFVGTQSGCEIESTLFGHTKDNTSAQTYAELQVSDSELGTAAILCDTCHGYTEGCVVCSMTQLKGALYVGVIFQADGSMAIHPPCSGSAAFLRSLDVEHVESRIPSHGFCTPTVIYAESIDELLMIYQDTCSVLGPQEDNTGDISSSVSQSGEGSGTGNRDTRDRRLRSTSDVISVPAEQVRSTELPINAAQSEEFSLDHYRKLEADHAQLQIKQKEAEAARKELSAQEAASIVAERQELQGRQEEMQRQQAELKKAEADHAQLQFKQKEEESARKELIAQEAACIVAERIDLRKRKEEIQRQQAELKKSEADHAQLQFKQKEEEAARKESIDRDAARTLDERQDLQRQLTEIQQKQAALAKLEYDIELRKVEAHATQSQQDTAFTAEFHRKQSEFKKLEADTAQLQLRQHEEDLSRKRLFDQATSRIASEKQDLKNLQAELNGLLQRRANPWMEVADRNTTTGPYGSPPMSISGGVGMSYGDDLECMLGGKPMARPYWDQSRSVSLCMAGPVAQPILSRDLGTFGCSSLGLLESQVHYNQSSRPVGSHLTHAAQDAPRSSSQGAPLPKPETKDLNYVYRYHARLEDLVSKEEPWIRAFTQKLLYESTSIGSSLPDSKLLCGLLNTALNRAFDIANKADTPGYAHHSAVWIFVSFCTPAMDVVFSGDSLVPSYSLSPRLNASYGLCLQTLFYQIQHLMGSPNASPGNYDMHVAKTFNRMNHSDVDVMIANWLTYPQDGLDIATAERKSLEMMRQKLGQLFHSQGDLDGARDALLAYETFRFDKSWEQAMGVFTVPLKTWLTGWWVEKRQLLAIAMRHEGVDYIRNSQARKSTVHIRQSVVEMVKSWDPTGNLPAEEFSISVAKRFESLYLTDRHLIESLFEQLPNKDSRWHQGQNSALSDRPETLFMVALPHVSSNRFQSVVDIMQYTFNVVQALEHTRLSDTITQLQVTQVQQAATVKVLETTQLQTDKALLQEKVAALTKQLDDSKKDMVSQSVKRAPPRVSFNTYDQQPAYNQPPGVGYGYGIGSGYAAVPRQADDINPSSLGYDSYGGHGNSTTGSAFLNSYEQCFPCELGLEMEEYAGDHSYCPVNAFNALP